MPDFQISLTTVLRSQKLSCSELSGLREPIHSMLILAQNLVASQRATGFCDELVREIGEDIRWCRAERRFSELNLSRNRRTLTTAAATSDVLVFAFDGQTELPVAFKVWMKDWGRHLFDLSPILLAVFDTGAARPEIQSSIVAFLGDMAEAWRLTFLFTQGDSVVEYLGASRLKPETLLPVGVK